MRNRVRVMCKPGSVGDLGGQPPRSTRPGIPGSGTAIRIGTQFVVTDFNGDGLLDIVTSNKKGVFLLEQVRRAK